MDKLQIYGGEKLFGSVEIPSSKNGFLPILAATILCEGKVILHKNRRFVDVFNMCAVLEDLGLVHQIKALTIVEDATLDGA